MLFISTTTSFAQEKCAIKSFQELQKNQNYGYEDPAQFESWMREKLRQLRSREANENQPQSAQQVITIPVVVHIINEGELIGNGTNLAEEQILSQIEVLNEDFRRLNEDRVNTPSVFEPVAADIEVNFVLAARDPEGLPTNGIVRKQGDRNIWQLADNYALKNLSYWPAEDYLNIWVTDLNDNYLGYAQFPVSSLAGLDNGSEYPFTDGVIIDYRAFGSKEKYPPANLINQYNLGRTTTHEVAHYLGLRHIWGDGDCSDDDFCEDTPRQGNPNSNIGEPCTFPGPNSCNTGPGDLPDMFQNYMDYSNDACLNLFTQDQKDRMRIVLDNSPRRLSLQSSLGAVPPVIVANDMGVRSIGSPSDFVCPGPLIPMIEVRNYGTNTVNSFVVDIAKNGTVIDTKNVNVTLAPGEITTVEMPVVEFTGEGEISFSITGVNGGSDGNPLNDSKSKYIQVSDEASISIDLNFSTLPNDWIIQNPDGLSTWELQQADNGNAMNQSLYLNLFDYENYGELDLFISPVIDLTDASQASLIFDVAYSGYPSVDANFEGLMITATSDCASPIFASDTVYYKVGSTLRTASSRTSPFTPSGPNDWRTDVVNLTPYLGTKVRLAFVGINGYGNNLYIDNVRLDIGSSVRLLSPGPSYCADRTVPLTFGVVNTTTETINYFELDLRIDNQPQGVYVFNGNLASGEEIQITTDMPELARGYHSLFAQVRNINNSGVGLGESGELSRSFIVSDKTVELPVRESFDNYDPEDPAAWLPLTQPPTTGWELVSTGSGPAMALFNQNNNNPGDFDYLIGPKFSLRDADNAFITFDLAYKRVNSTSDSFSVLLSDDCGISYDIVLFSRTGSELGNNDFNGQEVPALPQDWEKITINLTPYLGQEDLNIAFLGVNGNAGAIFVDNIEFFVSNPVVSENGTLFPNPSVNGRFKLTFNLPSKENVFMRVMDLSGRVVSEYEFSGVLNQTYEFDMQEQKQGVYVIQVKGETFSFAKRLIHAIY
ncbi:T9SS-dependent choice-of-anchor J family protein [Fulvivirga sedimenti]|uniref:Choice-of-anchor J domain-containing protein n=1 Tax=Fulvivirga sedimenti TaxID=2879465 RepID=A0A9X1HRU9_9BACT|nr:choice-of-anchor J domain-containing protein [Fulvivirga sedimenti]MCA6074883.1 choice-of-anchor J domain-containing protein [Fulvivirga sedimenti]MCA6076060.1 choice-of-anchor J domain-containing protein [Fulvivirga sedimenti]MCA6077188.1 choice-of-anchor J domain-containing protein [Fulvivirga sedimenti]